MKMTALAAVLVCALAACTDGAPGSNTGGGSGVTTISESLTANPATTIPEGRSGGFSPAEITVTVGTQVRFVNTDSFAHTTSSVAGTTFPDSSPLTASALTASKDGTPLSTVGWSSGNLPAGSSSPIFVADKPGTYLFGCFYHYGAPMRGAIVVH